MNPEEPQKSRARGAASMRLFGGILVTVAIGGCGMVSTRIEAEDNKVFTPALRASFNFNEGKQAASEPQTGHAIEFDITRARGSGSQFLDTSQPPLSLNNTTFAGPLQLRSDFDFSFAHTSWRWRKFFNERSLGLEVLAGAGRSSLGLQVSSSAQQASEHFVTWGPQGGAGLIWRFSPRSSLQGRVTAFFSSNHDGVDNFFRSEIFYAKSFNENLAMRVGYAESEVRGQGRPGHSDFKLRFSGPVVALDLNFNDP